MIVSRQSKSGCSFEWPVVIIRWNTRISRSAWVPLNKGTSIDTEAVYGLLRRTPKFRSPDKSSRINTPIWTRPTRAENIKNNEDYILMGFQRPHWFCYFTKRQHTYTGSQYAILWPWHFLHYKISPQSLSNTTSIYTKTKKPRHVHLLRTNLCHSLSVSF